MTPSAIGQRAAYDVAVVGAGVVGCAIARELARYRLRVVLLDAADDVGDGTTKASTAILHTGFDATPGTLESRLVARGRGLLGAYADEVGISVEHTGAVLVAWDAEQREKLPQLAAKAEANGYRAARLLEAGEVYQAEPHLAPGATGGLLVPDESIICPWTTTIALARQAVVAGVELRLSARLLSVRGYQARWAADCHVLRTSTGGLRARYLVNAAGLSSDTVDAMLGHRDFTVTPRRGELIVFDKLARPLVRHIVLAVPTSRGKGVLVAPTVYGNVLLGPTAEDVTDRAETGSSTAGLAGLRRMGARLIPELIEEEVTAVYAGLRAATEHPDYQLRSHPEQRYVCVGGIRSTGLSAAMAIAEHVVDLLADTGLDPGEAAPLPPVAMPPIGEAQVRPYQRADLVAADAAYGEIVCHCERVTRGELRDAFAGPVPACTPAGLRRRTRAMNGRCQGFFCGASVTAVLAQARSDAGGHVGSRTKRMVNR